MARHTVGQSMTSPTSRIEGVAGAATLVQYNTPTTVIVPSRSRAPPAADSGSKPRPGLPRGTR